jgi:leucyl aminopeptidase
MDFELKTLDLAEAARQKCDALVVLVTEGFKAGTDPVSRLVAAARKAGDLETKAGKLLQAYGAEGVAARAWCWPAPATARRARAVGRAGRRSALRAKGIKRIVICLPREPARAASGPRRDRLRRKPATSTSPPSPSPKAANSSASRWPSPMPGRARRLRRRPSATAGRRRVRPRTGQPAAQLATPTRLGEEAKKLAKAHGLQCEVLGPKEVAARHGLVHGRRQGLGRAAALHRAALPGRAGGAGAGGAGRQGHHLRHRRHLHQAGGRDGRDEVRHVRRGQRAGRVPRAGRPAPALNVVGLVPACENMPDGARTSPATWSPA